MPMKSNSAGVWGQVFLTGCYWLQILFFSTRLTPGDALIVLTMKQKCR